MSILYQKAHGLAGRLARWGKSGDGEGPGGPTATKGRSLLGWLGLVILVPVVCFGVTLGIVRSRSSAVHQAALSISTNGAPSIAYLSAARDDVRLIERRALAARPESLPVDRAIIDALRQHFDHTVAAYQTAGYYPGELRAFQTTQARGDAFFAAVDDLIAAEERGQTPSVEALGRVRATVDALSDAIGTVVEVNQHEVDLAGARIEALHRRSVIHDTLALIFVVAGTLMGVAGARHYVKAAEERRLLDAEHVAELDLFAGRVAHDLRNPLQSIQLRCRAAQQAATLERAREVLAPLLHQTQRMSGIIDALLAFARAAAHPPPGSRSEVAAVVQDIVAEAGPAAAEEGVDVVVEPFRSATVACDPNVLAVVLSNLVRNAVKHLGEGSGGLRRVVLRGRREGARLRVEVEDTGPGLPPGAEAQVFEPFVRLGGEHAPTDGIGLGLATVKRLVEAHRGQVGVESQRGRGCRFWFTLPVVREEGGRC
jgi:signal transduction histidine kinase